MLQENLKSLSWTQCRALIDFYNPSIQKISELFDIPSTQVKNLKIFEPDPAFDVTPYHPIFSDDSAIYINLSTPDKNNFATKSKKPRGRPGKKIITAFQNIPSEPVPVEDFASKWKISISVLRQSLRFDKTGLPGKVHVRQLNGSLMIWRDNK